MTRQQMIDALNGDLAAEYAAIIQYISYAAAVTGPHRPELARFFLAEVPDEIEHAKFLANKIAALGGEPTTQAAAVPHARSEGEMLERIAESEQRAVENYSNRARQAEELGDVGLKTQLETMVQDETGHYEEVQKLLGAGAEAWASHSR